MNGNFVSVSAPDSKTAPVLHGPKGTTNTLLPWMTPSRSTTMNGKLPRALIMAHYDPDGMIDPHVLYSLDAYRRSFDHITLVSVSADRLPTGQDHLVDTFIARENVGFDFFSWKIGFNALPDQDKFFEIVFVNDSLYGPLFDIEHVLLDPSVKEADFWGLTSSFALSWHIQSYFFSMRHRLLRTGAAQHYWDSVRSLTHKADVINNYEVRMAENFRAQGWLTETVYKGPSGYPARWQIVRPSDDLGQPLLLAKYLYHNLCYNEWRLRKQNSMNYSWRSVIEAGVPFVKVELLRNNPLYLPLRPIRDYIARNTRYPVELISEHLRRTAGIAI